MKKSWGPKDNGQDIHREFTGARRGAEEMLNTPSEKRNRPKPQDSIRRVGANLGMAGVRAAGGPPGMPDRAAWGALGTTAYNELLTGSQGCLGSLRKSMCPPRGEGHNVATATMQEATGWTWQHQGESPKHRVSENTGYRMGFEAQCQICKLTTYTYFSRTRTHTLTHRNGMDSEYKGHVISKHIMWAPCWVGMGHGVWLI